jgi:hypothetical protein
LGAAFAALLAATAACGDLKDLMSLAGDLKAEFGESPNLNVTNHAHLTVTFRNSRYADLPEGERAAFAQRVAEFVRDRYPGYDRLETVRVGFLSQRRAGIVTLSQSETPYTFRTADLGVGGPCLSYEPSPVTLTGTIETASFPWPSDDSAAADRRTDVVSLLTLERPACVLGDPKSQLNRETERRVRQVQLVAPAGTPPLMDGMQVNVSGTLFHAHTGHHHAPVLITVDRVVPTQQ